MINLLEHVEKSIRTRKLLLGGQKVLVAVSGGLDSSALLQVLNLLAGQHGWKLTVAHFNHKLRGAAAEGDERFVRRLASRLNLPFIASHADVRQHAKHHGLSVEMAARALRHQFLSDSARQLRIRTVAVAHHSDDQVELFFLRLLRGTGAEGLTGMKWRAVSPADSRIQIIRPLLDVRRAELEQFARAHKISFRVDASNASRDILRNRIRHELLPLLRRRFQPALNKTVLRSMDIISAEAEVVAQAAETWASKKSRSLCAWPIAIQRRVILSQLQQAGIATDFELIEALRREPARRINVGPGVSVERSTSGRIRCNTTVAVKFAAGTADLALTDRVGEFVFGGVRFRWQVAAVSKSLRLCRLREECFDADCIGSQIKLRHWQPGDRFQPIGMPAAVKLQDWFTNLKIPRARRRELVVATTATGEIFWIEGQRIAERFKLTNATKHRLIWRWQRL